ncbi:MAG: metal-sulfur cluster assembly factor [Actinomycetota bacterium]|jgi:metal-sulfur cluster biosynthetic enzyme
MNSSHPDRFDVLLDALREVVDPCCADKGISVVDMGLVRNISPTGDGVRIEMILTSGWCPFAVDLVGAVREAAEAVTGPGRAEVALSWDEAWGTHRLSEGAREKLRFLPDPRRVTDRDAYVAANFRPTNSSGAQS